MIRLSNQISGGGLSMVKPGPANTRWNIYKDQIRVRKN